MYVYGAVPPTAIALAEPLDKLLQLALCTFTLKEIRDDGRILAVSVVEQFALSVMLTE